MSVKIAILIDHPDSTNCLARSIEAVTGLVGTTRVEHVAEADIVVTDGERTIEGLFTKFPNKKFVLLTVPPRRAPGRLPENVQAFNVLDFVPSFFLLIGEVEKSKQEKGRDENHQEAPIEEEILARPQPEDENAPRVLVVDDTPTNIKSALETIPAKWHLTTAGGYDEAMEILGKQQFDAVLTDLHMPMSSRTLSAEAFHLGELVTYGMLIVMEALRRGVEEIAAVTDLSHHSDPFSAAFDHFTSEAIHAGRTRIRLLHAPLRADGSKDWGKVLD